MVKILHCGDLHIGANESFLEEKSASRRIESLLTFENIVETAKVNEVEAILISGDLFDYNKIEKSFSSRVLEVISSVPQIKVFYSCGNHDPYNSEHPFNGAELPDNLFIFPTKFKGVRLNESTVIYGKSFGEILEKGEEKLNIQTDETKINIMCLHGEYGFNTGRNPITDSFVVSSGMDYIALGHIHQKSEPKRVGNTYISYCGCPEGLGFDELGVKGVYILKIEKNSAEYEFVPTCRRMHICEEISVCSEDNTVTVCDKILNMLKLKYGESFGENLYKIVLCGEVKESTDINPTEIAERIKSETYFAKVYDSTEIEIDIGALANEVTLKGIFIRKMLNKIQNEPQNEAKLKRALKIGLKAFESEVNYNENN